MRSREAYSGRKNVWRYYKPSKTKLSNAKLASPNSVSKLSCVPISKEKVQVFPQLFV